MEKITTKSELLERLKDVRAVEIDARNGYLADTKSFSNPKLVSTIMSIKKDEDRHIVLLTEIIKLLEKNQ